MPLAGSIRVSYSGGLLTHFLLTSLSFPPSAPSLTSPCHTLGNHPGIPAAQGWSLGTLKTELLDQLRLKLNSKNFPPVKWSERSPYRSISGLTPPSGTPAFLSLVPFFFFCWDSFIIAQPLPPDRLPSSRNLCVQHTIYVTSWSDADPSVAKLRPMPWEVACLFV